MKKDFKNQIIDYINYLSELKDKYLELKLEHDFTMKAIKDLKLEEQINEKIQEYYDELPF